MGKILSKSISYCASNTGTGTGNGTGTGSSSSSSSGNSTSSNSGSNMLNSATNAVVQGTTNAQGVVLNGETGNAAEYDTAATAATAAVATAAMATTATTATTATAAMATADLILYFSFSFFNSPSYCCCA